MKITTIMKTPLSLKAVYDSRKMPLIISLIFLLMLQTGYVFPMFLDLITIQDVDAGYFLDSTTNESLENLDLDLSLGALSIVNHKLVVPSDVQTDKVENFSLSTLNIMVDYRDQYDYDKAAIQPTIRITQDYATLDFGILLYATYDHFKDMSFDQMTASEFVDYFMNQIIINSKSQWLLPLTGALYGIFTLMNLLFLLGMSGLAMIFRMGDRKQLKYKETFTLMIYASVLPTMIAMIVGLIAGGIGFSVLIYNFGIIMMYFIVRKKYLK